MEDKLHLNSNHHLKGVPKRNLREYRKLVKEINPKKHKSSDWKNSPRTKEDYVKRQYLGIERWNLRTQGEKKVLTWLRLPTVEQKSEWLMETWEPSGLGGNLSPFPRGRASPHSTSLAPSFVWGTCLPHRGVISELGELTSVKPWRRAPTMQDLALTVMRASDAHKSTKQCLRPA